MTGVRFKAVCELSSLYISRIGGVLVGIFFIPVYGRLLSEDAFGIVALILSIQALVLMLDLGFVTLVERDIAASDRFSIDGLKTWFCSEFTMTLVFIVLTVLCSACLILSGSDFPIFELILVSALIWCAMIQSLIMAACRGAREFLGSSFIQFFGVLVRALFTLWALKYIEPTVFCFISCQLFVSVISLAIARSFFKAKFVGPKVSESIKCSIYDVRNLIIRSKPLMVTSIMGALVMQFDKITVSVFNSPTDLGPYFLAFTLSMVPLSILGGPVYRFFLPKVIRSFEPLSKEGTFLARNYSLSMVFFLSVPSAILWFNLDWVLNSWLGDYNRKVEVADYVKILFPGFLVGALSYVPVAYIVGAKDFVFQAKLSVLSSLTALLFIFYFSYLKRIDFVCWAYVFYYASSTVFCWVRLLVKENTLQVGVSSVMPALALVGISVILCLII